MAVSSPTIRRDPFRPKRTGQSLVEFAIIAVVAVFTTSAALAICLLLFSANVLQQAADVAAQELARSAAPPDATFRDGLQASGLFQEADLIVATGTDVATLPLINRLLFPLYIYDVDRDVLRYPGTVVTGPDGEPTVLIPMLDPGGDASTGAITIGSWRPVVEEITSAGVGPYSVLASDPDNPAFQSGVVALRINYPYQSAAAVNYQITVTPEGARGTPTVADDGAITSASLPTGYTLAPPAGGNPAFGASAHRGAYGLGEAFAFSTTVRPYRRVISAQGIARREVFE